MNVEEVNRALLAGELDLPGLFPRLEALADAPAVFRVEFGLDKLPTSPGVILFRGARQVGKSTWLEGAMRDTVPVERWKGGKVPPTFHAAAGRTKPPS